MSKGGGLAGSQGDKDVDLSIGSLLVLVLDINPDQRIFFGKSFSKMSGLSEFVYIFSPENHALYVNLTI